MPINQPVSSSENGENGEDSVDAKPTTSNNVNNNLSNLDRWKKNLIPQHLDNDNVCTLFGTFLSHVKNEDFKKCIEAVRVHDISGKTLVKVSENEALLEKMAIALNLHSNYRGAFDKMIDFIRKRQKDIQREMNKDDSKDMLQGDRNISKKRKLSTSSETNYTIGAEIKHTKRSKGIYGDVNVNRSESATGIAKGITVDADEISEVKTGNINLTIGHSKPQLKEDI